MTLMVSSVLIHVIPTSFFVFFFSSRRRHTRCLSDWSSDVCSSDLETAGNIHDERAPGKSLAHGAGDKTGKPPPCQTAQSAANKNPQCVQHNPTARKLSAHAGVISRSEERRVGKE